MKKVLIAAFLVLGLVSVSSATLVTNMNQSALYVRLLSRNASTDIDAVYYNPAGLVLLKDGLHFGLNNQTVFQTKTVANDFLFLNNHTYVGDVNVPLFPDFYAVYKKGKMAFSLGVGPSAGGGTADFKTGLPSFEWQYSALPALITGMGIPTSKYSTDIAFKGSSIYLGFQFNFSYAFSDAISGAIGARYVSAKNTYEGAIKNVMINPTMPALGLTGTMVPATTFFNTMKAYYASLGNAVGAATMGAYAAQMADKAVDAEQTASGFTPIVSLNFKPTAGLNVAVHYEFGTKLEFTNKTTKDDADLFPDGLKFRSDVPAFLSLGANYEFTPKLRATASFNYFFDKSTNWEGREDFVNSNSFDLGLGFEYDISDMFLVSAGYLLTQFDLAAGYQSDMAHDMGASTFGVGGRIKLSPKFDIDLGAMFPSYKTDSQMITYPLGANLVPYQERYSRTTTAFAVSLNFHLGGAAESK